MGTAAEEDVQTFRYMNHTFSTSSTASDCSAAFSECTSDVSGEFSATSRISSSPHNLLVSSSSDSCYSDDAVYSLVSQLHSDDPHSQLQAATELRLQAKHSPDNRVRIARAGAVRPLVALISSPDKHLQEQGVTAILNLSLCDENKGSIAAAGAIRPLISALRNGTSVARENAACTLLRLAQRDDLRAAIGLSGAIPPLVGLLETGGMRGKKDAATALYTLCSPAKDNKVRAVQAGVVRPLLELMADQELGMVDKAAYVLATVAGLGEARGQIVEEGGIPVLVEMVEVGNQRQKEIAADILLQICQESSGYQTKVAKEGALPPLVDLSQSGTSRAKKKAESLINLLRKPRSGSFR